MARPLGRTGAWSGRPPGRLGVAGSQPSGERGRSFDSESIHRDKMCNLGELTAGIAHELNNPIGYISSNLNTLRRYSQILAELIGAADGEMEEAARARWQERLKQARWDFIRTDLTDLIEETRQGANHLKDVVGDLKTLCRTSLSCEQAIPDGCVRSALTVLSHQLKHRYQLRDELKAGDTILMVRSQIIQLVINLIHNAQQALGDQGGTIQVSTSHADGRTQLCIEDDGPGVPEALRTQIFAPFFTTKGNGTGLGLAIAAQIARNHGGDIRCDRSPGLGGARFVVQITGWQAGDGAALP
jgi:two-component system, NtrC family, sensor kinase